MQGEEMRITKIKPARSFELELDSIATDKSISHRSAIFALLAKAPCKVEGYLMGEDTLHTLDIARALGLKVEEEGKAFIFTPPQLIKEPHSILDCGNAGTAMRLFAGLLSGVNGHFVLSGDKYLNERPMSRITTPLNNIGACISGREGNAYAPLSIKGARLESFDYTSKIASAQVKSAMILAGLHSRGRSRFYEPFLSRNHTENMLQAMGVKMQTKVYENGGYEVVFDSLEQALEPFSLKIPADPSSAFYFALAACVLRSRVKLKNVLLNKTRIEAFEVLQRMGAEVTYHRYDCAYEEIGDIEVLGKALKGIKIEHALAWLIDEIPALSICFAIAEGVSSVHNAKELRVKESDRIHAIITNLRAMGIECEEFEDGFSVHGGELKSAKVDSFGDHRIAMSFAIALLACGGEVRDSACIDVSFPQFLKHLSHITSVENVYES